MARCRIVVNSAEAVRLMNSEEVRADLLARAERIRARAGSIGSVGQSGYTADVRPGASRAHAMVKTASGHAIRSNAKHNSLLKSIDAGKD